jgi:hypothetical protein
VENAMTLVSGEIGTNNIGSPKRYNKSEINSPDIPPGLSSTLEGGPKDTPSTLKKVASNPPPVKGTIASSDMKPVDPKKFPLNKLSVVAPPPGLPITPVEVEVISNPGKKKKKGRKGAPSDDEYNGGVPPEKISPTASSNQRKEPSTMPNSGKSHAPNIPTHVDQTAILNGKKITTTMFGDANHSPTLPVSPISLESIQNALKNLEELTGRGELTLSDFAIAAQSNGNSSTTPLDLETLTLGISSFFDLSAAALFGSGKKDPPKVDALGDSENSDGKRTPTSSHTALAALLQSLSAGDHVYATESELKSLEEQVTLAKKEAAMWETKLKQVIKRNRKSGLT